MEPNMIEKTLEKQLELLSECSKECNPYELAVLTEAMCKIVRALRGY